MYSLTDLQSRFNTYILMSISFYLLILSAELMPVVCFVPILSMAVSLSKCIAEIIWTNLWKANQYENDLLKNCMSHCFKVTNTKTEM